MYKAIVKWNGNHYFAGEEVKGSKIRTNEDGTVELFDDEPIEEFPYYGSARDAWVEVKPESVINENPTKSKELDILKDIGERYIKNGFGKELEIYLNELVSNGKILGYRNDKLSFSISILFNDNYKNIFFNRFNLLDLECQLIE